MDPLNLNSGIHVSFGSGIGSSWTIGTIPAAHTPLSFHPIAPLTPTEVDFPLSETTAAQTNTRRKVTPN